MAVKEVMSVENGAGLLLSCVGHPVRKAEFSSAVEALAALHAKGIHHGDPRMANVVQVAGSVRWLDFRGARFPPSTTPGLFKDDMTALVCSLLSATSLASSPRIADAVKDCGNCDFSVQQINAELTDCIL